MMTTTALQSRNASSRRAVPLRRVTLLAAGVAAFAGAVVAVGWLAPALWLVPDLTMLAGMGSGPMGDGRLPPRAVPYYNAAHRLAGPLAVVAAGVVVGPTVLGLGLTWLSHVLIDRGVGYGLRAPDGLQRD